MKNRRLYVITSYFYFASYVNYYIMIDITKSYLFQPFMAEREKMRIEEKDMILAKIEVPGTAAQDNDLYNLIQSNIYYLCFGLVLEKTGNIIAGFLGRQVEETDFYQFVIANPPETINPEITSDDKAV